MCLETFATQRLLLQVVAPITDKLGKSITAGHIDSAKQGEETVGASCTSENSDLGPAT